MSSSTAATCSQCQNIPLELCSDNDYTHILHPSLEALKASAENGCHSCTLFYGSFLEPEFPILEGGDVTCQQQPVSLYRITEMKRGPPLSIKCGRKTGVVSCFAEEVGFSFGSRQSLAPAPDADENLSLIEGWIDECILNHPSCSVSGHAWSPPTRLLDVGSSGEEPRLVLGDDCRTFGNRYLALSHCWGPTPIDAPWKTTKARLQSFWTCVSLDILPLTFREAIDITRGLGERYIWIDSLCIVQDSHEDWAREAASMATVYSSALCTIVSASDSSSGGCLIPRKTLSVTPCELQLSSRGELAEGSGSKVTIYPSLPYRKTLMRNAPVNSRAWCQQEQQLSRRIVQFTPHQILWKCNLGCSSEANFRAGQEAARPGEDPKWEFDEDDGTASPWRTPNSSPQRASPSYDPFRGYYRYWYTLIEISSLCKITIPTDRLPSLSGIAQRQRTLVDDTYLAGLWKNDILRGLLWSRTPAASSPALSRPTLYLAPSWSWACLNAAVSFESNSFNFDLPAQNGADVTETALYKSVWEDPMHPVLLDADTEPSSVDKFGQVKPGGYLILQGFLRTGSCNEPSTAPVSPSFHYSNGLWDDGDGANKTKKLVGQVFFDTLDDLHSYRTIICLYIFGWTGPGSDQGGGLALVPVTTTTTLQQAGLHSKDNYSGGVYKRVGYVDMVHKPWFQGSKREVFTLI